MLTLHCKNNTVYRVKGENHEEEWTGNQSLVNVNFLFCIARNQFLNGGVQVDPKIDFSNYDCSQSPLKDLCISAQSSEETWVNFKLFGTLGLTLVLIVITVLMLSKHIKEKQTDS